MTPPAPVLEILGRPVVVDYLAHQPQAVEQLVLLMEASWPDWYGQPQNSAHADLLARSRKHGLPLGLVALWDGEAIGTCALTERSGGLERTENGRQLAWLGGLLVRADLRRRGIGSALLRAALVAAAREKQSGLLALTANADALFLAENWQVSESLWLDGAAHRIYRRTAAGTRGSGTL